MKITGMANLKSPTGNSCVRILIVDDHPNTATTLARAISQLGAGIEVDSTDSGERALELVREKAADLLITDMMMPGMNGLELIEKLQSIPGGRPAYTVLITAYDVPGLKETARRLKVNDVIIKPIRPERICQIVSGAIENLGRAPSPDPAETKTQAKILVTDDLPDNVTLLARYLQNDGYCCISAANGVEALAKIRAEMPDLVLLDINMPIKDGFETLQEIRSDPSIGHIPVIFLTARMEPMDMQSALNMGADDYVTKPFDRRELLARIRTRLRVKEAEDVIRRRNRELNLLPEIGKELSARLDIDELVDVVLRRTVETLGAFVGYLVLLSPEGSLQSTHHFSISSSPISEIKLPPLKYLLDKVKESRQGIIINDTRTDSRWQVSPDDPSRSVVIVPMFGRLNLLGLLILAHEQMEYFTMEHRLLLQAISSQAAIALENALLYKNAASQQEHLEGVLQSAPHPILMFDKSGCVLLANLEGEKLFSSIKLGEPLERGHGYDELLGLVENPLDPHVSGRKDISWPDGRNFLALRMPTESGGCTIVFQNAGG